VQGEPTVFVVDDDPDVRKTLAWLVESIGLRAETFASAAEFLDAYDPARAGCLLLDVRLRGMSGYDLLERLGGRQAPLPVIMMTAYGDFSTAVRALRGGASDIFEKPFNDQEVLERITQAIASNRAAREARAGQATVGARLALLTPRERGVLELLMVGKTSKAIAAEFGLSVRTVESHRTSIQQKMGTSSTAQLVSMVLLARARP